MSKPGLTISKLAKSADVNVETVRYYQRVGLITQPVKPAHGYRQYSQDIATRIRFIKRAQRLGFALKEIDELLMLDDGECQEAKELAVQKLSIIEKNIADLSAMKASLDNLLNGTAESTSPDDLALVNAITN